ncbi:hypothetical protein IW261DRAFT_812457 [Armillaria novae-zelandiae]|uniref:Uncharacterized protein n=1 Tax=Armillaria novae-zelandiae TaxID=153914 RepID=A0AA39NV44_9AGAR|nr:hypothetical protein IW261DRAFT_812457 [Armillaria novae-zelandiae]
MRYRDLQNTPVSIPRSMHALSPPPSELPNYSTASLVRGDSGSMFREEVWPPPRDARGHSREQSIEDDPFRAIMTSPLPSGAAQPKKPSPHANYAYMKELRTLLLPPMKNIVRRLVIECVADGCDTVRKACKMFLDDVVHELKDEAVWFDGFDWLERRRNDRLEARKTEQRTRITKESSSGDDSSLSS